MQICVFGLGEAGSRFASDLVGAGADVHGYDPAEVPTPDGVTRHDGPTTAVFRADLVLALTAAVDAHQALDQARDAIPDGAVYADCSTAAPHLKVDLADHLANERHGVAFADVALLGMVPVNGIATPSLASGAGAERYATLVNPLGARVEPIEGAPGVAAGRKLLRSVFMKGVSAVTVEALRAAGSVNDARWLWQHLVAEVSNADEEWLNRLITGVEPHAIRRWHEMEAASDMLDELGVEPVMTRSTAEVLRRVPDDGVPELPAL